MVKLISCLSKKDCRLPKEPGASTKLGILNYCAISSLKSTITLWGRLGERFDQALFIY